MKNVITMSLLVMVTISLTACDKINRASRTMDTMLGNDFDVYIQGHPEVYKVRNGKVTSVPEKGYYVFYPIINGKERMVQSPIQITTIVEVDE
ncbi:MAG: hypothetical protein K6L73_05480 [Cellvibrionaceae bacterium]